MVNSAEVAAHLRERGITVHHATPAPPDQDERPRVAVFLEGYRGQHEAAALAAAQLPGVNAVEFAADTTTIMLLTLDP